jgi:hypothetical protein
MRKSLPFPNRKTITSFFLFALLCFDTLTAYSTTEIVIVTSEGIIFGSDAKGVTHLRDRTPIGSEMTTRKAELVVNNRFLIASAGAARGPNYDFFSWVNEISHNLPKDISLKDFVSVVERESATIFTDEVLRTGQLTRPPLEFCKNFIEYLIAGYQDDHPWVYTVRFEIDWESKRFIGPLTNILHRPQENTRDFGFHVLGAETAISEIENRNSYAYKKASTLAPEALTKLLSNSDMTECQAAGLIRALIKVEEEVSPSKVGGIGEFFFIPVSGPIRETKCSVLAHGGQSNKKNQK